jgi:RNA polymerase sigma-70 factor (ECF subfamily)
MSFRPENSTGGGAEEMAAARDDAVLTARIAGGDSAAFDLLYRRISLRLQRVAWLVCEDPAEAADIVQDVFLRLWSNARLFDSSRGTVYSWLAAITRHRSIDWVRSRHRRSELLGEFGGDGTHDEGSGPSSPVHSVVATDDHRAVRQALAALPGKMKRALELIYFDHCTHLEAAAHLCEPVGTVKSRIRRGLDRLRRDADRGQFSST